MEKELNELLNQIQFLERRQQTISNDINDLKKKLEHLKEEKSTTMSEPAISEEVVPEKPSEPLTFKESMAEPPVKEAVKPHDKNALEKFIGENLINKVGIIVLVIGISIGVKYAIDHNLISPLVRIILGYIAGVILMFFAWRVRKNYTGFSAVLLSGAMAAMYFITYAAFAYYNLYSLWITFGLLTVLTVFTVAAAIYYNRQIIAHIGLVGAYAIPFLLHEPASNITFLFSYMLIINAGILYISFKKYWKVLNYSAFLLSWAIFLNWYFSAYSPETDIAKGFTSAILFFTLFYLILLLYKLVRQEKYNITDILLLLANSFIFFGIGYSMLHSTETGALYQGLFTICNAMVHGALAYLISERKPADTSIFHFVAGLSLVFLTIAIPVQLNGSWVTLLWAGEATILFLTGRVRKDKIWEFLSYILMVLAFYGLLYDWMNVFPKHVKAGITPLFNADLLSSLVFIGFFTVIIWIDNQFKAEFKVSNASFYEPFRYFIPGIIIFVVFVAFFREIVIYWDNHIRDTDAQLRSIPATETIPYFLKDDMKLYKFCWLTNYTLVFASLLSTSNLLKFKHKDFASLNMFLNVVFLIIFLAVGLGFLGKLRLSYIEHSMSGFNFTFKIFLRYFSIAFAGILIYLTWKILKKYFYSPGSKVISEFAFHFAMVCILSSELINLMELSGAAGSNKLGLSILWGVYSLFLIVIGIWKNIIHLRIFAILLFAITLIKLFFYDLAYLDTISKTIVFVILGALLLIISFLYNKFKHLIL